MRGRFRFLLPCLTAALLGAGCDSEPKLKVEIAKTPGAPGTAATAAAAHPPAVSPGERPAPPISPGAELPAGHPPVAQQPGGTASGDARLPVILPGGEGGKAVAWTVPAGWKAEPPANPTRRAQYRIPGPGGDGECVVFYFGPGQGGDPASNADRWAAQFEPAGGQPAASKKTRTLKAGGMTVLVVEAAGTYLSGSMTGGEVVRKPGWALLGAVVEGPDANWYFKLTGPKATVDAQRSAFDGLLKSLKRGG